MYSQKKTWSLFLDFKEVYVGNFIKKEEKLKICGVEYIGGAHRYYFTDGSFIDTDEDLFLKYPWYLDE